MWGNVARMNGNPNGVELKSGYRQVFHHVIFSLTAIGYPNPGLVVIITLGNRPDAISDPEGIKY